MKLTILDQKKNKLHIEVEADHTLCNVIKKELWNDKSVHVSGYYTEHIQVGSPRFMIETADKDPLDALRDAIKRLKKTNAACADSFSQAK